MEKAKRQWIGFAPTFPEKSSLHVSFREIAVQLRRFNKIEKNNDVHVELENERNRIQISQQKRKGRVDAKFVASINLLVDLIKLDWRIRIKSDQVQVGRPEHNADNPNSREQIRMQLHAERNEQLRKKSVQTFVQSMEAKHFYNDSFVSIFSLMRDGRELSEKLLESSNCNDKDALSAALGVHIKPYIQFVREGDVCNLTGFKLMDIWRYFRCTWANPYKSIPGRSMMVLIRDAATKYHTIMGIAALSSATIGMNVRDHYIGWSSEQVLGTLRTKKSLKIVRWMFNIIDDAIKDIYKNDLYEDNAKLFTLNSIVSPNEKTIEGLIESSQENRKKHYRFMQSTDYKQKIKSPHEMSEEDWEKEARTLLFRSKRELELSNMLKARVILRKWFGDKITKDKITSFVNCKDCKDVVSKVVRKAKSDRVGTVMADLTVCGGIPPYNEILSGKLTAMLMTSPEMANEYKSRYGRQPSIIASSMAGKAVIRPSDLVFISTTSLFGQRPNQYDRIAIPYGNRNGSTKQTLRYKYLGQTMGVGTFHFSESTVNSLSTLVSQGRQGQRVNSVFGDGANPRIRFTY